MRFLVIGCGSIGKRHLAALRALGVESIDVFRTTSVNQAEIEREFGVRTFFDLDQALDEADAVVIANPTSAHIQPALKAARQGKHLLIEKPLSHNLDGVGELKEAVAAAELVVQVGYNLRFHPALVETKRLIQSGEIGTLLSLRAWAGQYLPDWHPGEDYSSGYVAQRRLGGGVILTLSHEIDYMRWLGGEVSMVSALSAQPSELNMDTESLAEISLGFAGGALGSVHLDCLRRPAARGFEIIGQDGLLSCDIGGGRLEVRKPGTNEVSVRDIATPDANDTYREELGSFIRAIESGEPAAVTLHDGIRVLEIALAALQSSGTQV